MLDFFSLKTEAFGLEITDSFVRLAQFKKNNGVVAGMICQSASLPAGAVKDGEVLNQQLLARAISRLAGSKKYRISAKYVVASLPESKAFLEVIQMPRLTGIELRHAIVYEAENYIPLPINKVYLDFEVINNPQAPADHSDVLVVAMPRTTADAYVLAIKAAGLKPLVFEPESQAIIRSIVDKNQTSGSILIIQIGDTKTNLIVYAANSPRFTFSIPISNSYFLERISKSLNISLERAEILKATQGISTFDRGQAEPKKSSDKKMIFEAMIPGLVDFVQQTAKCLEYYKTHASHEHGAGGEGRVGKVILCGSGANLKGLDEFVSLKLNTPVIVGDFRKSVDPEVLKSNAFWGDKISGNFDVAAGLALRALKEEHIDD